MRSGSVLRGLPVRLLFLTAEEVLGLLAMNLQPFLRARGEVAGASNSCSLRSFACVSVRLSAKIVRFLLANLIDTMWISRGS